MADAPGFVGHAVGFYFESIVMIFFFILLLYLYRIYKTSQNKLAYTLVLANIFYFTAMITSWLTKIVLYMTGPPALSDPIQLLTRFKLSMVVIILGHGFSLLFFKEIFMENPDEVYKKKLLIRKIIEGILVIVLFLPGLFTQNDSIALVGDATGFLIVLIDTYFFIPYAIKSRKKSKENESLKKQFVNITLFGTFIFFMAIMLLLDRVALMIGILGTVEGKYSVFYYCIWISLLFSIFFAFRSFVLK